jgi:hypothetical protein
MTQPSILDAMSVIEGVLPLVGVGEQLRFVQAFQDALDAKKATLLAELDATKAFEEDGASTIGTWVRNELRMTSGDAATLVRAAGTFKALPLVAAAAAEGSIRADHVRAFTYGLKHLGIEIMTQVEAEFVASAQILDPAEFTQKMRALRDVMFPDDLDAAYIKGMDKEDINVTKLLDGWHVTGFLDPVTGLKFKKVLDSVSAPRDADDHRTGSERRVQGFDDLLSSVLNNGLPSDKGVRPHASVIVNADTLIAAAKRVEQTTKNPHLTPDPLPQTTPAELVGYGAIGPNLLMYMMCISDFTAFLMKDGGGYRAAEILNVGRDHRLATLKQRRAIIVRQMGICATPGCTHTHLEIHHVIFWSHGGMTDLNLMIGLCSNCHGLLHKGRLHITGNAIDGFEFTNRHGAPLRKQRQHRRPVAA